MAGLQSNFADDDDSHNNPGNGEVQESYIKNLPRMEPNPNRKYTLSPAKYPSRQELFVVRVPL